MVMELFSSHHRIGIIGPTYSGKTVLTASIINHLKHHDKNQLVIKNRESGGAGDNTVEITFDKEYPPYTGFDPLPYHDIRKNLHTTWPEVTETIRQYRCSFYRSDWPWTKGHLSLVDVPGQRLVDLPMADKSFAQWSDWVSARFAEETDAKACADWQDYWTELGKPAVGTPEDNSTRITDAYRDLLKKSLKGSRSLITPSTFLLNPDGEILLKNIINDDLAQSFTGISQATMFAPIPEKHRKKNEAIMNLFERNYNLYKSQIVFPMLRALLYCNSLVFLVDITTILALGPGWYNLTKAMVEDAIKILGPGTTLLAKILGWPWTCTNTLGLGYSGIQRIAFVVPKADIIRVEDHEAALALLQDLTKSFRGKLNRERFNLEFHHDVISAVWSTETIKGEPGKVRAKSGKDISKEIEIILPKLPGCWEDNWDPRLYNFPSSIAPFFPARADRPPNTCNLNKLLAFLLKPAW